ncbi:integrase [Phyllobacterium phragmitis]|uniref:Integrase n=1 Tax=Phyllobacterium phragmitis TaxID=2670329 RepID=A0A2S9IWN7_9HYPH|nr:integrase [Phyllobacterium phragmitis]
MSTLRPPATRDQSTSIDADLPDIIATVMTMGQIAEPEKGGPVMGQSSREATHATNTRAAYIRDWRHYAAWCRRRGLEPLPPNPEQIGLYLVAQATPGKDDDAQALSAATIERRLSGLAWNFAQRGFSFDRSDSHLVNAIADIRRHARPPAAKESVGTEELHAMLGTLGHDLRGLRDRAILLVGFAGGLRRSEITGLDIRQGDSDDGTGWIDIQDKTVLVTIDGTTGGVIEIGRSSSERSCPVATLENWMRFSRISRGPLFRRILRDGKTVGSERLNDRHIARLVKQTALAAGIRGDLSEDARAARFAGQSLRGRGRRLGLTKASGL